MAEQARDASYTAATQAQNKVSAAEAALAQLQTVACDPVYERVFDMGVNRAGDNYVRQVARVRSESFLEGWLACLAELGVPEDNPAWTNAALAPVFPEPPVPYSPMILPGFDEEYVNWQMRMSLNLFLFMLWLQLMKLPTLRRKPGK